ncbi:DUF3343 domain-containing protein [Caldisalinibacter kiritimatiensis]|uniref:Putative Se/S carrier protein-like domain-containing protein n=1 Tax=Caldisalinibacter kiritimatiensis TaxID=1304284 RepID=R1ATS0_9FIRM|nr:DUF3343 domain-containing protein [Caldisalinibacter kiritimatiensis]EOD00037.1 hypothetical protein L21TH_1926 [Caldisalinibacter kiritimatiensis]
MIEETYFVMTFDSTHYAIKAEKVLKEEKIDIRTIPTPREITASCGLAIKFSEDLLEDVKRTVEEKKLNRSGIYKIMRNKNGRTAERINVETL